MIYRLFLITYFFSCCAVMSEYGYAGWSLIPHDRRSPTSGNDGTCYMPSPKYDPRIFIKERLENNGPLFEKCKELESFTIEQFLAVREGFEDLQKLYFQKKQSVISELKKTATKNTRLQLLPAEIQLKIFQYAVLLPSDFTNSDYRKICIEEVKSNNEVNN